MNDTKRREKAVQAYHDQWSKIGMRTCVWSVLRPNQRVASANKSKAKKAIELVYGEVLAVAPPREILFATSPIECQLLASFIADPAFGKKVLKSRRLNTIQSGFDIALRRSLRSKLDAKFNREVVRRISLSTERAFSTIVDARGEIDARLAERISTRLDGQLTKTFANHLGRRLQNNTKNVLRSAKLAVYGAQDLWSALPALAANDYFLNEWFPKLRRECKTAVGVLRASKDLFYYVPFEDVVIVSEFPHHIAPYSLRDPMFNFASFDPVYATHD